MAKESREVDGEEVYGEINPVREYEGVDVEQFERMTGAPYRHWKMQRGVPHDGSKNETDKYDIGFHDIEDVYLLAVLGRDMLESYGDSGFGDILEVFEKTDFDNPYDEIGHELKRDRGGYTFLDWMEEEPVQSLTESYGWKTPGHFDQTVQRLATFTNHIDSALDAEGPYSEGVPAVHLQSYRQGAQRAEELVRELEDLV